MKNLIIISIFLLAFISVNAQNTGVSISTNTADAADQSAMLDIKSNSKGILIPRVMLNNVASASPVTNPAKGLLVYSENGAVPDGFYYWNGVKWLFFVTANLISDFGSGKIITNEERLKIGTAVQTELDPVFNASAAKNITNAGSGIVISASERNLLNSALQSASGGLTSNTIPVWNGTKMANGPVTINGTKVITADTLKTNARIKDKTGLVMPVGTILPYAGTTLPEGWLWCDGTPYLVTKYPDLYSAIKIAWGGINDVNFNVPDLRGVFLRGVNGNRNDAFADPDSISGDRLANGNGKKNAVGSFQNDMYYSHNHSVSIGYSGDLSLSGGTTSTGTHEHQIPCNSGNGRSSVDAGVENGTNYTNTYGGGAHNHSVSVSGGSHPHNGSIGAAGGSETRPKNAYVNYIIKY